jgi:aryl-alcohol dehydrogenase-like predicted oxidoreductase
MVKQLGVSTVVYNPLAGGLLTGKYSPVSIAPETRFATNKVYVDRYWHPQVFKSVEALKRVAADAGKSLASLPLIGPCITRHPTVSSWVLPGLSN